MGGLAQGSTVVTLVTTTCSETLETEHRLCKDKDLCLAEERGLGVLREPQGPRLGRQQEKAALNCSRNLPWLETEDIAIRRRMQQEGGALSPRTPTQPKPSCLGGCGRVGGSGMEGPRATSSLPGRENRPGAGSQ